MNKREKKVNLDVKKMKFNGSFFAAVGTYVGFWALVLISLV